eukprot:TRINITY_DN7829_c0_g1_i1.p1 TRINITY_DN7829_c0_g1~~TRINITY_DN7829_c0_g1_i1.p1  ORF type:complete len:556 (+),score=137.68 TRINITY_DN7829_c0_g1_i1:91-1668(+)
MDDAEESKKMEGEEFKEQPNGDKKKRERKNKGKNNSGGQSKRQKKKEHQEQKQKKIDESLCLKISRGEQCPFGDKCKFNHDVQKYLNIKPADIAAECPLFNKYGKCPYGIKCRFALAHREGDNFNVVNQEKAKVAGPDEMNELPKDLQTALRKNKYAFPKAMPLIKQHNIEKKKRVETNGKNDSDEPTLYYVETPLKADEKKKLDLKGKLVLAPLTTTGNLPFRRICKEFGADITVGEMALAANLLEGQSSEWALLKRHASEDVFGVQICGCHTDVMTKCAEVISDNITVDFVDINMGCPIDLIVDHGAGSALLERTRRIYDLTTNVSKVLNCPLTIKVRTGKDEKAPTVHKIFDQVHNWGVSGITIHGRSRLQRYSRDADWNYIARCAALAKIPVIGNGDIYNYKQYEDHMEKTGVSSVMLARGALIKPWLFQEIKEKRHMDIRSSERLEIYRKYMNYGLEHWGSDQQGVDNTRRFFLECHRYSGQCHRLTIQLHVQVCPSWIAWRRTATFEDESKTSKGGRSG